MIRIKQFIVCGTLVCIVAMTSLGCASAKGKTPQEKRDYTQSMKEKALAEIYAKKPQAKAEAEAAPGYAVIDDIAWGVGFLGSGGGYGVITDNATKQQTYIKLFHFLPGFGIAGKNDKQLVIFKDADMLKAATRGAKWDTSGEAEAAFKFGETGGSALASGSFDKKIQIYKVTSGGIVLRALIPINDYYPDKELNEDSSTTKP